MQHGGPNDDIRHLGDFGNIMADPSGNANIRLFGKGLNLSGPESIAGRAFVVHSKEDDLGRGTNPESKVHGNSGVRVACGVVVLVP
jgi:superoxide dismutase, Cu-Zn family